MYVRRGIRYEKVAFCSPEEYSSVADELCFLKEFHSQVNKALVLV